MGICIICQSETFAHSKMCRKCYENDNKLGSYDQYVSAYTKNQNAVELGRLGGLKGGKARAISLSAEKKRSIAKEAAANRWKDKQYTITIKLPITRGKMRKLLDDWYKIAMRDIPKAGYKPITNESIDKWISDYVLDMVKEFQNDVEQGHI